MNIADIDRMVGYSEGFGPIAQALQWLDTLTRAPSVQWSPGQREAAVNVLRDARRVLYSDLIDAAREALGAPSAHVPNVDTTVQGLTTADGGERVGRHELHDRDDDLTHCKVCGGAESSLPTECPGSRMTEAQESSVTAGTLDYRAGRWASPDLTRAMDERRGSR